MDRRNFIVGATALGLSASVAIPSSANETVCITSDINEWMKVQNSFIDVVDLKIEFSELAKQFKYFMLAPTGLFEGRPVFATTKALRMRWNFSLAQDLKSIYGLDVETELRNVINSEAILEVQNFVFPKFPNAALHSIQVVRALDPASFEPYIGFKIRYAEIA